MSAVSTKVEVEQVVALVLAALVTLTVATVEGIQVQQTHQIFHATDLLILLKNFFASKL